MSYLIVANAETSLGKFKYEGRQRAGNETNEYQTIALWTNFCIPFIPLLFKKDGVGERCCVTDLSAERLVAKLTVQL
jgi:hypothetical protein